jgi:hydrogenase maturation protease
MAHLPTILVAGVGNRLMGDDGFGPRVIDLLESYELPSNVEIRDIGTAGLTIATDLDDYDLVVFLDTVEEGQEPGDLIKVELKVKNGIDDVSELAIVTLHEVGLEGLLRFSKAIGTLPQKVFLVGCKPETFKPSLDLSPKVENSLNDAAEIVLKIIDSI